MHRFAVQQRELYKKLPVMSGAPIVLRRLSKRGIRIRIITDRLYIKYYHHKAVNQTIEWLDYHDIPYWDLCFMKNKTAVGANLYIEDCPQNILELRAEGNETIVFSNSTNKLIEEPRADNWFEVENLVLERFQSWQLKNGI